MGTIEHHHGCQSKEVEFMFRSKRDYPDRTVYFARYFCTCGKVFDVPLTEKEYQEMDVGKMS